jgi:uncharacterized protein YjlB
MPPFEGAGRPERRNAAPTRGQSGELVQPREAQTFLFQDDGFVPNHPRWPLVLYPAAVRARTESDPAAIFEDLFMGNGWGASWRNGIYNFTHYHSEIHEVLGIARGSAEVQFGGDRGRALRVTQGDVAILPAGTGHRRISATPDLLVVGAYPPSGKYDLCRRPEDRQRALATIPDVPRPRSDPVYGPDGPLLAVWT